MAQPDAGFRNYVGLEVRTAGDGRAEVHLQADDRHLNPHGALHGGALGALADAAMGTAVGTLTDGRPVTIEMNVTYRQSSVAGDSAPDADASSPADEEVVTHAIATFTTLD
jgi:uncharacterized protein (TIGR00369 family)